jgi:hypothetical protein
MAPEEGNQEGPTLDCVDCDQPFKTAQGLAGHRRLAHSTSIRFELEAKQEELARQEAAARRRESEVAQRAEATRRHAADVGRREQEVAAAEAISENERLSRISAREVARLTEVRSGAILRVQGVDYRISEKGLDHVYFPAGEKTELAPGQWFRFGGRAYRVRDGRLREVPTAAILARLLGEED